MNHNNTIIVERNIKVSVSVIQLQYLVMVSTKINSCFSILILILLTGACSGQLSTNFYSSTCPNLLSIIKTAVTSAVSSEARMGASLLRLHFHDCFVNASSIFMQQLIICSQITLANELSHACNIFTYLKPHACRDAMHRFYWMIPLTLRERRRPLRI